MESAKLHFQYKSLVSVLGNNQMISSHIFMSVQVKYLNLLKCYLIPSFDYLGHYLTVWSGVPPGKVFSLDLISANVCWNWSKKELKTFSNIFCFLVPANDAKLCPNNEEGLVLRRARTFHIRGILKQFFTIPGLSNNSSTWPASLYRVELLQFRKACSRPDSILARVMINLSILSNVFGAVSQVHFGRE